MSIWDSHYEDVMADLAYEDQRDRNIEEFKRESLQSYYRDNSEVAKGAFDSLTEARQLLDAGHFTASYLFAAIAIEAAFREALVKPVVYGLIHNEELAEEIVEQGFKLAPMARLKSLVHGVVSEYGGVDMKAYKRPDAPSTLSKEIESIRKLRNTTAHRGDPVDEEKASHAVAVAQHVLEVLLPTVLEVFCIGFDEGGAVKWLPQDWELELQGPDIRDRAMEWYSTRSERSFLGLSHVSRRFEADESGTKTPVWWFDISVREIEEAPLTGRRQLYLFCEIVGTEDFHYLVANNLLAALHRWASAQDENFITEAFAHLLQHLLRHEAAVGVGLLRYLTGGRLLVSEDDADGVSVVTQGVTDQGTPDIKITTSDHHALVEVKVDSPVDRGQLERYRRVIDASGFDQKTLVLLTRHAVEKEDAPDVMARWYKVAHWLRRQPDQITWRHPASGYLVEQFVGFLQERGITMEQVTWQMVEGVKSMRNLVAMVEEVLMNKKQKLTASFGRHWSGFYVQGNKVWVGLWHDNPEYVAFQVDVPYGEKPVSAPDFGEIGDGKYAPFRWNWSFRLHLSGEDAHFFALSQASQMRRLEDFVDKGLSALSALANSTVTQGDSTDTAPLPSTDSAT
ncbi:MAG: hypothetical protein ACYTKD_04510 [Planctomycetota bacterium]|jgi:hypothetical protein